jgi:adenine-specific DNA-methyltransferase
LGALVAAASARALVVSFNDEGYLPRGELEAMLATRGPVRVIEHDYKRYVGAQIGIHNPQGERVGRVSHLRNKELIYVVAPLTATAAARVRNRSRAPSRA